MSLPETAVLITAHAALPGQQQQRKCNGAPAARRTCRGFCFAVRILQGILPACRRAFGFCIALLTVQQFMDGYAEYVCNGG